jgi:hypothetical protein
MMADRSTRTQETTEVTATDSEGRSLFATTSGIGGYIGSMLEDPVAGTRIVWNSENMQAKILELPTPVAGRRSCWKLPDQEQHLVRGEAQVGIGPITCVPAEQHQASHCAAPGNAVDPPHDDSPEVKASYEDCSRALSSVIIRGKISERNEDLGEQTTLGFVVHGCRSTVVAADGTHMREAWVTKFGTARRNVSLPLRSIHESPNHVGPGATRITSEATNLELGEPDAEMFHLPEGYLIRTLQMVEVPCEQLSNVGIAPTASQ